jgi:hypothetical protein
MNTAWDTIRENIKISANESTGHSESKHHKPWFDKECPIDIFMHSLLTPLFIN